MSLTEEQIHAIQCAYLDLVGALQSRNLKKVRCGMPNNHGWESHKETIRQMENAFSFIRPVKDMYEKGLPSSSN
jgi:isocitrate dehydrogenase